MAMARGNYSADYPHEHRRIGGDGVDSAP
jgi:hypothetical protein